MSATLIGLLLLVAGTCLTFIGARAFLVLLPAFSLVSGFFVGASIVASALGAGFLSTIGEWVVGYVLGMLFAIMSFVYWYAGVTLATASVGAMTGMGLLAILGVDTEAILWAGACVGGIIGAIVALFARSPQSVMICSTAIGGAIMIVSSLSLIFRKVELQEVRWGADWNDINVPWSSWLVLTVLAATGVASQWSGVADLELPDDRWIRADAAARQAVKPGNDRWGRYSR